MVADINTNKKFQSIINELFIRCRKLNISRHLDISHSEDIDYEDFMKIYRKCVSEPYSFLTIDTILPADNPLRFRKYLYDSLEK